MSATFAVCLDQGAMQHRKAGFDYTRCVEKMSGRRRRASPFVDGWLGLVHRWSPPTPVAAWTDLLLFVIRQFVAGVCLVGGGGGRRLLTSGSWARPTSSQSMVRTTIQNQRQFAAWVLSDPRCDRPACLHVYGQQNEISSAHS